MSVYLKIAKVLTFTFIQASLEQTPQAMTQKYAKNIHF